jgi:hypothetical protein
MVQRARLAGGLHPICQRCASVGADLLRDDALEQVRHCLHLFAMEVEAIHDQLSIFGSVRSWVRRVQKRLSDGELRRDCPCNGCSGKPVPGAIADLHEHYGIGTAVYADTMPLSSLRAMRPAEVIRAEDGGHWRAADEVARRLLVNAALIYWAGPASGGLADRAKPTRPGEWVTVWNEETGEVREAYLPINHHERAKADDAARRHWQDANSAEAAE